MCIAVRSLNPTVLRTFDTSCFSGTYVTGDISVEYLSKLALQRNDGAKVTGNIIRLGSKDSAFESHENTSNLSSSISSSMANTTLDIQPTKEDRVDISNGFGVLTPTRQKRNTRATSPDQL